MQASLTPERWEQLQHLFDEVVDLEPAARAVRLDTVCHDDPGLREEVESLLAAYAQADELLQSLDQLGGAPPSPASPDGSRAGTRVGHYEVIEKLGSGGMGVVYKARDTRLKRIVALKFLPLEWSHHTEARQRFENEAQAASALDHPNICTIHDIGETDDGHLFIAMAYYEGETLKKKIKQGPLPLEDVLNYVVQMARGLAKAHTKDIVHRDIKPANVMVTSDGVVKVLDFGLAKMAHVHLTKTGTRMGTIAYMSPEQTRGRTVDHRTDLWSLGVVLYEMLAGERPFEHEYDQAIIYSLLNEDPTPITELNPEVPEALEHVVTMCLEKESDLRYPTMTDLLADLEVFVQDEDSSAVMALLEAQRKKQWIFASGAAGLLVLLLLVLLIPSVRQWVLPGGEATPALQRLVVLPFSTVGEVDEVFSEGLLHTITGKLTSMEQFRNELLVIPTIDVLAEGARSTRAADSTFGVSMVITGSITQFGDLVRLTLNLVDVASGGQSNSRTIDARPTNLLAFQDDVVRKLAELMDVELNPESEQILLAGGTTAPGAYEFYIRGQGYLQRFTDESKVDAAITVFQRALDEDPDYALAYAGLGEAYWRKYERTRDQQWVDKAITTAQQALDLNDGLAPVHVTLGLIYRRTSRYPESEQAYHRALEFEPNNAEAYRGLGHAYNGQNKLDLAQQSYKKAIELRPDYWSYYNDLGIFYHNEGRHEEAAEQFKRVTELEPDNPWGYNNLGVQYQRLGRLDEAIPWYEKATQINPNEAGATARGYLNLGSIYYIRDDFAEAVRMYEAALVIQDLGIGAWADLGNAYHWIGENDKAREAWQRTISLAQERLAVNPASVSALEYAAFGYAKLGEREPALSVIERLLDLERKSAETLRVIAKTYERLGERDSAMYYIEKALASEPALTPLETSEWLNNLRADPRYQALIQAHVEQKQETDTL